jgi:hypothetical protein
VLNCLPRATSWAHQIANIVRRGGITIRITLTAATPWQALCQRAEGLAPIQLITRLEIDIL